MKALHMITWILVIIGGLNWLLVGIFGKGLFDFLNMTARQPLPMLVYLLVGISTLVELFTHKANCKMCGSKPSAAQPMM